MKNQKGMEMPIQIFITLFVLLAVAILVLTLVSQQFGESTAQLDKQKRDQQFQQDISLAKTDCQNACQNACSNEQRKTAYCITKIGKTLNISKDENTYDESYLAGVGICEDTIYCPQIYDCDCGGAVLTMSACKETICNYWDSVQNGGAAPNRYKDTQLRKFIVPGQCWSALSDETGIAPAIVQGLKNDHWLGQIYGITKTANLSTLQCP